MPTMSVKTLLQLVPRLPVRTSVLLRGNHGIGKSKLARQIAAIVQKNEGLSDFPVIDRRLSQMSEGDMIGLPSTDGEVTRFNPPDWYKKACNEPCFLLLDELNRATSEVMQASFQIVLDRELNGWKLHEQSRVMAAVNNSQVYNVNEIDPALLDRFWCIDLEPTVEDWLIWAKNPDPMFGGNMHPLVVDFHEQKGETHLDPPKNYEPGSKVPSRRSWEAYNNALVHMNLIDNPDDPLFYSTGLGFIGTEATIAFHAYAKSIDTRFTGEDLINDYKKVKKKLDLIGQERLNVAVERVAEFLAQKEPQTLTDKQGKNLQAFMNDLPAEIRLNAWAKFMAHNNDKLELIKTVHKWCAKSILDIFGVPMGEAGVGVTPNIPGILQKDNK